MKFYWLCILLVQIECVSTQEIENDCQLNSFSSVPMVGHNSHLHHLNGSILDGCKHVYLDVGSNMGVQIRKLFEPDLYFDENDNTSVIHRYIKYFGMNKTDWRSDVCAIGFEPNPAHTPRLKQLARRYSARGWRTTFIFAAASDHNSISTYNGNGDILAKPLQMGGRLMNNKGCIMKKKNESDDSQDKQKVSSDHFDKDINVYVIDFGEFLYNQVKNRKFPLTSSAVNQQHRMLKISSEIGKHHKHQVKMDRNSKKDLKPKVGQNNNNKLMKIPSSSSSRIKPSVLVKLDIEGAEYDVTARIMMLNRGTRFIQGEEGKQIKVTNQMLDIVDMYMIEWHDEEKEINIEPYTIWASHLFKNKWERLDDESFRFDPFPLPVRLTNNDPWSTMNVKDHGAFWREITKKTINDDVY